MIEVVIEGIFRSKPEATDVEKAMIVAGVGHFGQKYGGMPYIVHPIQVAEWFEDRYHKTLALLHDVLEDTEVTPEFIERHFGVTTFMGLDALTKRKHERYYEYLDRCMGNSLARPVKIADIHCNRYGPDLAKRGKYEDAWRYLFGGLRTEIYDVIRP